MTNRRSKAKKSTSKPKGTTQPTSSKVKLTIPARPAAAQPVASTPVTIDPPEASSPQYRTPSVGPELEDDIIITPRPKTPPLSSIGVKKALENLDSILCIDDSDMGGEDSPVPVAKISKAKTKAAAKAEMEEKWQREFRVCQLLQRYLLQVCRHYSSHSASLWCIRSTKNVGKIS